MLDPLTALSVAGTIVQFVDFSYKVITGSVQLYKSGNGVLKTNEVLDLVTSDLLKLTTKLHRLDDIQGSQSDDEKALIDLCTSSNDIADEILSKLKTLKSQSLGKDIKGRVLLRHKTWATFRGAIKSAWKEEELSKLNQRLSGLKQSLELRVLVGIREKADLMSIQMSDRFNALDQHTQNVITALLDHHNAQKRDLNVQIMAISKLLNRTEVVIMDMHDKTRAIIVDAIQQAGLIANQRNAQDPSQPTPRNTAVVGAAADAASILKDEALIRREVKMSLLNSLEYPTRTDREQDIVQAHQKTFKWIFLDSQHYALGREWSDFGQWLRHGSGIYWINGKAASGKSTLMRYITNHSRTAELLARWASPLTSTSAAFFFWNSGTPEQKSHSGFLRSLLFEVLGKYPELVPIVLPWLWAKQYSKLVNGSQIVNYDSWTLSQLEQAFKRLIEQNIIAFKLCLFVDGLDEYDGDHQEITTLFQLITSSSTPNIKVCVSSRPLLVFEDAFGEGAGLRLQDLTSRDIAQYVNDKLGNSPRFRQLALEEPERAPELIEEIVNKADGVFLWVTLVVKSLLSGLGNRDSIFDLQRRLKLLPSDLQALYSHMATRIDPFYLQEASETFRLVRTALKLGSTSSKYSKRSRGPLTTLELAFATAAKDNPELGMIAQTRDIGLEAIFLKCQRIEDRLKVCCAGLLEVHHHSTLHFDGFHGDVVGSEGRIQYLHRTVRDYLEQPETWALLGSSTSASDFNPYNSLLQASILQLKFAKSNIHVWHVAMTAFESASCLQLSGQAYSPLINEMDKWFSTRLKDWCSLYLAWLFGDHERLIENNDETFLAALVHYSLSQCLEIRLGVSHNNDLTTAEHYGLHPYLEWKRNTKETPLLRQARPLLSWVRSFRYGLDNYSFDTGTFKTISLLLDKGFSPNETYHGMTPWENVLYWQYEVVTTELVTIMLSQSQKACWVNIFRLFLEHGADPEARVIRNNKSYSLSTALDGLIHCGFESEALEIRQSMYTRVAKNDSLRSRKRRRWTQGYLCGL